jgi:hypothetical protein
MTELDTTILNLLGKEVSFSIDKGFEVFQSKGIVTDIVFSHTGSYQISVNEGDFYFYSDMLEFQILA